MVEGFVKGMPCREGYTNENFIPYSNMKSEGVTCNVPRPFTEGYTPLLTMDPRHFSASGRLPNMFSAKHAHEVKSSLFCSPPRLIQCGAGIATLAVSANRKVRTTHVHGTFLNDLFLNECKSCLRHTASNVLSPQGANDPRPRHYSERPFFMLFMHTALQKLLASHYQSCAAFTGLT
jgi:hypothetical protein